MWSVGHFWGLLKALNWLHFLYKIDFTCCVIKKAWDECFVSRLFPLYDFFIFNYFLLGLMSSSWQEAKMCEICSEPKLKIIFPPPYLISVHVQDWWFSIFPKNVAFRSTIFCICVTKIKYDFPTKSHWFNIFSSSSVSAWNWINTKEDICSPLCKSVSVLPLANLSFSLVGVVGDGDHPMLW